MKRAIPILILIVGLVIVGIGVYQYIRLKSSPSEMSNFQFTIPMNVSWTNSGIQLSAGQTLIINAKGTGVWKNISSDSPSAKPKPYEECGPDGTPPVDKKDYYSNINNYQSPIAYKGALIGKIGEYGVPFPVGSKFQKAVNENGILYLGINDIKPELGQANWDDNSGGFIVTIQKR